MTGLKKKLEKVKEMFNSDATIGTVEQENVEDAIEIFARLNSGGTNLKSGDIQVAQLAQEQTASILPEMRKFMMTTENQALGYDFAFSCWAAFAITKYPMMPLTIVRAIIAGKIQRSNR